MRLQSLEEAAVFTCQVIGGALAGGSLAGVVGLISKYALPKLGFSHVCGIALTAVSRHAFKATMGCYAGAALLGIPLLVASLYIPVNH